jgi:hypothetical protein
MSMHTSLMTLRFASAFGVVLALVLSSCTTDEPATREREVRLPAPVVIEQPWEGTGHLLRRAPKSYQSRANRTLKDALDVASDWGRKVLSARLGLFTDKDQRQRGRRVIVDVPAWVITVRTCVPIGGPSKSKEGCASNHLNVVVNADTGRYMQAFAP